MSNRNITVAFGADSGFLKRGQIAGGPDWIRNDRFDVVAKVENSAVSGPPNQMFPMLRTLLEDRFALKTRPTPA